MGRLKKIANNVDDLIVKINNCLNDKNMSEFNILNKELLSNKQNFNKSIQVLIDKFDAICNRQLSNILDDSTKYENVNQLG